MAGAGGRRVHGSGNPSRAIDQARRRGLGEPRRRRRPLCPRARAARAPYRRSRGRTPVPPRLRCRAPAGRRVSSVPASPRPRSSSPDRSAAGRPACWSRTCGRSPSMTARPRAHQRRSGRSARRRARSARDRARSLRPGEHPAPPPAPPMTRRARRASEAGQPPRVKTRLTPGSRQSPSPRRAAASATATCSAMPDRSMKIEVLFFDGCPNHEALLPHLRSPR